MSIRSMAIPSTHPSVCCPAAGAVDSQTSVSTVNTFVLLMLLLYRVLQFCFLDSGVTRIPSSKSMMSEHESDNESRFFLVWPVTNQRTESIKSEQDPSTRAILPSDSIQQPINSALPRYGHDFRQPFSASFPLNRHSITFHPTHF